MVMDQFLGFSDSGKQETMYAAHR
uniref:Uncharacterized protein n=1 Tax=Rhizophora mucronata TaxID=61149 RepID=A0A2P2N616_RHIMU